MLAARDSGTIVRYRLVGPAGLGDIERQGIAVPPQGAARAIILADHNLRPMRPLFLLLVLLGFAPLSAQQPLTPVVPFGGIYDVPEATVRPDPLLEYRIVVDVFTGAELPEDVAAGVHNVARMLNLFSVGGVPPDHLTVVLAIHGGATYGVMDNASYRERFEVDNPNLPVLRALKDAGVKVTVCGQSLISREIDPADVAPEVDIATSMLTTVATYQMMDYAVFRF